MADLRPLFELQGLDLTIDARRHRLGKIDLALGDETTLDRLRRRHQELQEASDGTNKQQKDLESTVEAFIQRILQAENKLFGGTVSNPRELSGFQADIAQLKRQRSEHEDRLLVILDETDRLRSDLDVAETELRMTQQDWNVAQMALIGEQTWIRGELSELRTRRDKLAESIAGSELVLYDQIRRAHAGKAVTHIERGMCSNCKERLPTQQLQAIRVSQAPIRCSSCGLILLQ